MAKDKIAAKATTTEEAARPAPIGELVGYARVSSRTQDLGVQVAALTAAGVKPEHLYQEKASGTTREGRKALDDLLARGVRRGDVLVCTRLDRVARSLRDLQNIAATLQDKGVGLRVLEQPIDTTTAEGRLFFGMLGAIAEFETELRKSRQAEGIKAALAKGPDSPFKGRPATIDGAKVRALRAGGMTPAKIAQEMKIARSTVYRLLDETDAQG